MPAVTVEKEGAAWAHVDWMCFAFLLPEERRVEEGGSGAGFCREAAVLDLSALPNLTEKPPSASWV